MLRGFEESDKPHMLQEISLAGNFITDMGAESIADFLDYASQRLKVLVLHWNKITYKGGLKIANVLKLNQTLKVLDLSWNTLGKFVLENLARVPVSKLKKRFEKGPVPDTFEEV